MKETLTEQEQEALLGRPVERLLTAADRNAFADRTCLITGAGGSVGSELASQLAACRPSLLVLVDHSEHALFRIEQELKEHAPSMSIEPVLCDVTRAATVARMMRRFRPDIVFHAAAYKHVTMAERAICAAARVNVLGTIAVLAATREVGGQFVLISSDKAAAPRSVMGATKRFAELVTLASISRPAAVSSRRVVDLREKRSETSPPPRTRGTRRSDPGRKPDVTSAPSASFVVESLPSRIPGTIVVRFGNILASSGSFVEIMRERIREGCPVLVTDPNATRFFMTVTEATSLVMKASTLARGGETFWLDMGDQVRIGDLAERLVESAVLSGLPPVPVKVVGLRPGEKLVEQLASQGVSMRRTAHERIWVARQTSIQSQRCAEALRRLRRSVARDDALGVLQALTTAIADFEPSHAAWAVAREGLAPTDARRSEQGTVLSVA
jgi:FlaA1/EpsC-like NDP-sugar epimerase